MALLLGMVLIAALGALHHFALSSIRRLAGKPKTTTSLDPIIIFIAVLVLHVAEILLFAGVYAALLPIPGMGHFGKDFTPGWQDFVYYSGINFVTLGYTQIEASGPIRLISMLQSLGGFMILTWSATFLYSASKRAWEN